MEYLALWVRKHGRMGLERTAESIISSQAPKEALIRVIDTDQTIMRYLSAASILLLPLFTYAQGPCDWLDACFEWEVDGNSVSFFNCTPNESGIQYLWHFGDGSNGEVQNPIHTYAPGTYTVCLLATWEDCADDICHTFTIGGGQPCDWLETCFEWEVDGNSVSFFNCTPNESGIEYLWHFGDGSNGEVQNPIHTYAPGTYTVCLLATWEDCADDICHTITIGGGGQSCEDLQVGFSMAQLEGGVQFTNTTTGTGFDTEMVWYFGDGTQSDAPAPWHLYTGEGVVEVCLVVATSYEVPGNGVETCAAESCASIDQLTVGVQEAVQPAVHIYPNPAHDQVWIEGDLGTTELRLFGADGRLIIREQVSTWPHSLNVAGLSPGVHVIDLRSVNISVKQRLVIE